MRTCATVLLLTFTCWLPSCAYLGQRLDDLRDVGTLSFGLGVGARVRLATSSVGIVRHDDRIGFWGRRAFGLGEPLVTTGHFAGLGFTRIVGEAGFRELNVFDNLIWPFAVESRIPAPYYTDCEVIIGLGPSVRVGLNPGELLDFFVGWFGFDIYGDDAVPRPDAGPAARRQAAAQK